MIVFITEVDVEGLTGKAIYDFLINCTPEEYQRWWNGTHLILQTLEHYPDNIGNLVVMDEYIGKYRLKSKAVVVKAIPEKEIVWQVKKIVKLPIWLSVSFEEDKDKVKIKHEITAGFNGMRKIFDIFFRIFLSEDFEKAMNEHAKIEFPKLKEIL